MTDGRLHFTFHQCLGKGGFGEVYLATMKRPGGLEQRVAVKVLKQGLHNEDEAVRRLKDEGRMLATLEHPVILTVYDLVRLEGRVALVTEYVDGVDCARLCRKDRQAPERVVVAVIRDVASALDAAWSRPSPETGNPLHLIHRDIKPENIRISRHGAIKLLDFGIARTTELSRDARTSFGDLPFTPGYAPPEAFTRGRQGAEADVYALGASAFRMLAAERLYQGMSLADQVRLTSFRDEYEPWLDTRLRLVGGTPEVTELLRTMLAYAPEDRPTAGEAHDLAEHLFDALDGPSPSRWAKATNFPTARPVEDASLTGKHLAVDPSPAEPSVPPSRPATTYAEEIGDPKSAPPPVPKSLAAHAVAAKPSLPAEEGAAKPPPSPLRSMYSMAPLGEAEPTPSGRVAMTVAEAPPDPPRRRLPLVAWLGLAAGVLLLGLGVVAVAIAVAVTMAR